MILSVRGNTPTFGEGCRAAPTATLTGDVVAGRDCTFWFGSVVRGDVHGIRLGNAVNVQDNAVLHCTYQRHPLRIGNNVSIGHGALVHGCTIADDVLVGMGATVMDGALVDSGTLVAAGAVVTQGTHCRSGFIYAGLPAKRLKPLSPEAFADEVGRIAAAYPTYAGWYGDEWLVS